MYWEVQTTTRPDQTDSQSSAMIILREWKILKGKKRKKKKKFYQSLACISTVTDECVLLNCHEHYIILLLVALLFALSHSFVFLYPSPPSLICLPARLQKHRISIDSLQIMMTSIHYSSSHSLFLSLYLFLPFYRQIFDASGRLTMIEEKKRKEKR